MEYPEHERWLIEAIAGNQQSLVQLLEALGPVVRSRIAPKLTGAHRSVLDEDDVMQVTYLEAATRLETFGGGGAKGFLAWLHRLAENNLIDAIRALESAKRPNPKRRVTPRPMPDQDSTDALINLLGVTTTTPSRDAARSESARVLDQAMAKLPADYERVVRMYDLEGRAVEEVAEAMGRSHGAIFMLRARAHDRLREILGSAGKFFSQSP